MEEIQVRLGRLRSLLFRVVFIGLALSYFMPGFCDGHARMRAAEFVLFLHVFLPVWAWGCYSYLRSQWTDEVEFEACCRKCGYDLVGFVREKCPGCGKHVKKQPTSTSDEGSSDKNERFTRSR